MSGQHVFDDRAHVREQGTTAAARTPPLDEDAPLDVDEPAGDSQGQTGALIMHFTLFLAHSHLASPPPVPQAYIKVVYHPHSGKAPEIVSLDSHTPSGPAVAENTTLDDRPWAPFRSRADFEFAESAVNEKLSRKAVDVHLTGMHGSWSRDGSNVSFRDYNDLRYSLDAARDFVTDVSTRIPDFYASN